MQITSTYSNLKNYKKSYSSGFQGHVKLHPLDSLNNKFVQTAKKTLDILVKDENIVLNVSPLSGSLKCVTNSNNPVSVLADAAAQRYGIDIGWVKSANDVVKLAANSIRRYFENTKNTAGAERLEAKLKQLDLK